jgi:hypothetical protein
VPEKGNTQVEAAHTMQNIINLMSMDVIAAKSAVGGSTLTLTMVDSSVITYSRSGDTLIRNIDDGDQIVDTNVSSVSFTVSGKLVTMNITTKPENRWDISETRSYRIAMRPT